MNRQKRILLVAALALMGLSGLFLGALRAHQRLGLPAVRTSAIPGSIRLHVELAKDVLTYASEEMDVGDVVRNALPKDTSFGQRCYKAPDGFAMVENVVLMGSDRTSLHKPQICLRGSGWVIDKAAPEVVKVSKPQPYDLPVMKLTLSPEKPGTFDGMKGVYVYWFVADGAYTRDHWQRMWWMFTHLLRTGTLQRWAYINCFAACRPGQEDATFARIQEFIAASVPQYQLVPPPDTKVTARQ